MRTLEGLDTTELATTPYFGRQHQSNLAQENSSSYNIAQRVGGLGKALNCGLCTFSTAFQEQILTFKSFTTELRIVFTF
jgi:hypothetical protein